MEAPLSFTIPWNRKFALSFESLHDLGVEILRAADDERKIAFETGCVFSSLMRLSD
jgi:hypothetical protein